MAHLAPNPEKLESGRHTAASKIERHVEPMGDTVHYIRWDAPGVEFKEPGEQDTIQRVSDQFKGFQERNFNEHHHCFRGTHLKTQGCVKGTFRVLDNLPQPLAQGMFSKPGSYECMMRYSSLTPKMLPDTVSAPRGAAIKVFGVEGEKLFAPDRNTQDFLFNNYDVLELRTPKATNEIADALERNWHDADGFVKELKARDDAEVACMGGSLPQEHMAAMTEHSQSAYRYGDYVVKYGLIPTSEAQKKLKSWRVKLDDPPNVLSQSLQDFHMHHKATFSFVVQFLENLDEQPVEDIGVSWNPDKYPFHEVAVVEFPEQDSFLPGFRNYWNDRITCNTWHGLKEHQPLGSANRMRRTVYAESRKYRLKMNGVESIVEPSSLTEVPSY